MKEVCVNCIYTVWSCGLYCAEPFDGKDPDTMKRVDLNDTCDKFERYAGADYDHSESEGALT